MSRWAPDGAPLRRGHHSRARASRPGSRACTCPWPAGTTSPMRWPPSPWRASWTSSDEAIKAGLAGFGGVKRRFTTTGVVERRPHRRRLRPPPGRDRRRAQGRASGRPTGRVIAVVQPHRYTRLRDLMEEFSTCFSDADTVIVADVYPAGEAPIEGVDKQALVEGVRRYGHRSVAGLENVDRPAARDRGEAQVGRRGRPARRRRHHRWAYALPGAAGGAGVSEAGP